MNQIKTWEQRMPSRLPESMIDCAMMQVRCMADEILELRQAIEQAERAEPVGYLRMGPEQDFVTTGAAGDLESGVWHPLYLHPPTAPAQPPRLGQGPDYERGFVDGMQHQMQSSVDKAVNARTPAQHDLLKADLSELKRTWVGLRSRQVNRIFIDTFSMHGKDGGKAFARAIEAKLKEQNT